MQQDPDPGGTDERLPDDLEVSAVIGDPGTRAVGVRSLEDGAEPAQPGHDVVADPTDDLAGLAPGV